MKSPNIFTNIMLLTLLMLGLPANGSQKVHEFAFEGGKVQLLRHGAELLMLVTPDPGFKTYAINPGPSGLSPELIQDGQPLVLEGSVPKRFYLESGDAYLGYDDQALFKAPWPEDTSIIEAYLGFCEELCLPASFSFLPGQLETGTVPKAFAFPEYRDEQIPIDADGFVDAPAHAGAEVFVARPQNYSDLHGQLDMEGRGQIQPWPKQMRGRVQLLGILTDGRLIFAPASLESSQETPISPIAN